MLKVAGLTRIYKLGNVDVKAMVGVSLDINPGEIVCIMGKSGSGKSTLLRQLGLIDRPTSGSIIIDGQEATTLSDSDRSQMRLSYLGYIFQEFALITELTAHENVYLPSMMLGDNIDYRSRAAELLGLVGLADRLNHKPKELSGGEQQRVAIARALINKPRILFADEPCANLDSISSKLIMDTLVKLNADLGLTIVYVSHDPDDKQYTQNIIYLKDGKQVAQYI
ncbi:ABC transporter ATP-binding protein [Chloroflexota bacterium]